VAAFVAVGITASIVTSCCVEYLGEQAARSARIRIIAKKCFCITPPIVFNCSIIEKSAVRNACGFLMAVIGSKSC
jgi:hypothetical protein